MTLTLENYLTKRIALLIAAAHTVFFLTQLPQVYLKRLVTFSDNIEEKLRKLLKEVKTEPHYLKRIPVKSARGMTLVLTEEIDWIASAGHYLKLHAGGETHLIRERLSQIETRLDPQMFMRIHRSTIVNLDRIKSLHPLFNGDQLVILKNGQELNLSRTYHEKLMRRLVI